MMSAASIRIASLLVALTLVTAALGWGCSFSESWTPPPDLVATCRNGVAVPDPAANPGLVRDCAILLASNDIISPVRPTPYWDPSQPISEWSGVAVSGQPPRVTKLAVSRGWDRDRNAPSGTIPPEIGYLDALIWLDVETYGLSGAIPATLGNLSQLEGLTITGSAYKSTAHWTRPEPPPPASDRAIVGEIPPELGKLKNLRQLVIVATLVEGPIPPELGNLERLEYMDLTHNYLSGPIPKSFGRLRNLENLELYFNALSGPLPAELGQLEELDSLALGVNRLSGEIPPWIGGLSNLRWLDLSGNEFTGEIPPEIGSLTELQTLDLGGNDLTGRIPPELGNLRGLSNLYLSDNRLMGTLPKELSNIEDPRALLLSNNQFSGPIPNWIGEYPDLDVLYIDGSGLTGCLPSGLRRYDTSRYSIAPGFAFCDEIAPADYENAEVFGEVSPDQWQGALNAGAETVIEMARDMVKVTIPPTGAYSPVSAHISADRSGCRVDEPPQRSLVACLTVDTFQANDQTVAVFVDGATFDISMRMFFGRWRGALVLFSYEDIRAGMQVLRRDDSGDDWMPVGFGFEFDREGLSRVWTDSVSLPGEFAIVYDTEPLQKAEERILGSQ